MISKIKLISFLFMMLIMISACGGGNATQAEPAQTEIPSAAVPVQTEPSTEEISGEVILYSGRSEPLIQPVLDAFKAKYPNVNVLLKAGSNSELANALIEERSNPQADIFITTELFTVQSLAAQGVFDKYLPAGAEQFPAEFRSENTTWTGLTRRARVIIYNKDIVEENELPSSIFDLTDEKWKGQIAAAGSTNGGMQAQIAAMHQLLREEETRAWLEGLIANDVTFFKGHTDVRKAVGTGEFKLGLVNHYYYHLQLAEGSNIGVIYPDQNEDQVGLFTNATAAGIVKGAKNVAAARAFLDFLVSSEGQKLFAEQNYEYPLLPGVALKEGVLPLDGLRFADVDVVKAALDFESTFDLIEKVGLP